MGDATAPMREIARQQATTLVQEAVRNGATGAPVRSRTAIVRSVDHSAELPDGHALPEMPLTPVPGVRARVTQMT